MKKQIKIILITNFQVSLQKEINRALKDIYEEKPDATPIIHTTSTYILIEYYTNIR